MKLYRLDYGTSEVTLQFEPIITAVVRVWRDEMHVDHLAIMVKGRDAGGASGTIDLLEVWFSGWLSGWMAGRDAAALGEVTKV